MIDALDKQTKDLPLEQPKRGRGRPATGQAMTPAEKQRAYRERQKAQRNELEREVHNAYATSRVDESVSEDLFEELEAANLQIRELKEQLAAAIARAEEAEAQYVKIHRKLREALETIQELKKSNVTEIARAELAEARADVMGNELAIIKAKLGTASATIVKMKTGNVTEKNEKTFWHVESKAKGAKKWLVIGQPDDPFQSLENAEAFAERLRSDKSAMADGWKYRVVQAKAPE